MEQSVPAWTVVSTQDDTGYGDNGRIIRTKRVGIRFADGHTTYLEVPVTNYNAETVQQLADAAANQHNDVMSLRGEMVPKPQRVTFPTNRNLTPS